MYRVSIEGHFDAAHYLRGYGGKCEKLHGHRYKVIISLKTKKLNDIGLAYDFVELKRHLGEVLEQFDHNCVNDVPPFDELNASAENIARTIYNQLKGRFVGDAALESVEVWESPQNRVTYTPD
jgi:6-pyruvoyltetrahydropterin/6-carboxytetrahydropterin synthase